MNLLAHLYLADLTGTSAAGQLLGDRVKGRLDGAMEAEIERGIRLHRAIDGFTDRHPLTAQLRDHFAPPLRRYAGILVDIGFDYCLARSWAHYSDTALESFAETLVNTARQQWPAGPQWPHRPGTGLTQVLIDYRRPAGLQRALNSVDARLRRPSPLPAALPALLAQQQALTTAFDTFFPQLCAHARRASQPGYFQSTTAVPRTLSS